MRKVTISRLKPEKIDQYVEMHRNVPTEVCEIMAAHHHRNHSVYLYGDKLFQYFDYTGTDFEADMKQMRQMPVMQAWWAKFMECVLPFDETASETWVSPEEIFYNA